MKPQQVRTKETLMNILFHIVKKYDKEIKEEYESQGDDISEYEEGVMDGIRLVNEEIKGLLKWLKGV